MFVCEEAKYIYNQNSFICFSCAQNVEDIDKFTVAVIHQMLHKPPGKTMKPANCSQCRKTIVTYSKITDCDSCYSTCSTLYSRVLQRDNAYLCNEDSDGDYAHNDSDHENNDHDDEDDDNGEHMDDSPYEINELCVDKRDYLKKLLVELNTDVNYLDNLSIEEIKMLTTMDENETESYEARLIRKAAEQIVDSKETAVAAMHLMQMKSNNQ